MKSPLPKLVYCIYHFLVWFIIVSFSLTLATIILICCPLFLQKRLRRTMQRASKSLWAHCFFALTKFLAPSRILITTPFAEEGFASIPGSEADPDSDHLRAIIEHKIGHFLAHVNKLYMQSLYASIFPSPTASSREVDRDIMICNHLTYNDWTYLWYFIERMGRSADIIILLKQSLSYVPIIGGAIANLDFIYLRRKWQHDQRNLFDRVSALIDAYPLCFLLFPEGTTLSPATRDACAAYAEKKNIRMPDHVLLPRSTGLWSMMETMGPLLNGIYNVTVAYTPLAPNECAETVYSLSHIYCGGQYPETIHFDVEYIPMPCIPQRDQAVFSEWLAQLFYLKEKKLKCVYSPHEGSFGGRVLYHGPMLVAYYRLSLLIIFSVSTAWMYILYYLIVRVLLGHCM